MYPTYPKAVSGGGPALKICETRDNLEWAGHMHQRETNTESTEVECEIGPEFGSHAEDGIVPDCRRRVLALDILRRAHRL